MVWCSFKLVLSERTLFSTQANKAVNRKCKKDNKGCEDKTKSQCKKGEKASDLFEEAWLLAQIYTNTQKRIYVEKVLGKSSSVS